MGEPQDLVGETVDLPDKLILRLNNHFFSLHENFSYKVRVFFFRIFAYDVILLQVYFIFYLQLFQSIF